MRFLLLGMLSLLLVAHAEAVPERAEQLIVSIAPGWDAPKGKLQRFEKVKGEWRAVSDPVPALYGRSGLAWGRGVAGQGEKGPQKVERDRRAPAGIFKIGKIYTYDAKLPEGAQYPFRQVTTADAWIDDPEHPQYNKHVVVDPKNPPEWFEKQKMRHNDFAYRWLVEVRHNSDPPVAGKGSAIFFHIRRGTDRPTAGCTTLAEGDLVSMIKWLRADRDPHYVLLPWDEYQRLWKSWKLPPPEAVARLAPS